MSDFEDISFQKSSGRPLDRHFCWKFLVFFEKLETFDEFSGKKSVTD